MCLKDVFSRVCEKNDWPCEEGQVVVSLGGGRSQVVLLEQFDHGGEDMIRLTSRVGCEDILTPERLRAILSINFRLAHGALALNDSHLVMTNTFLVREADHDEVEASIRFIASEADRYEKMVYGQDLN